MGMRIAIEVWGADLPTITRTAQLAERLGLDAFYYGEAPGPVDLDCWTTLAHLAGVTERIRLGPIITNALPEYRSTHLLAKQAATVALASRGRLDFRTGVGASRRHAEPWWGPFGIDYPDYDTRLSHLGRTMVALKELWGTPGTPGALGLEHPPIPTTIAATGHRAIELAHHHASMWEVSFRTPSELADLLETHPCPTEECNLSVSLEIDGFLGSTPDRAAEVFATVAQDRAGEDLDHLRARALVGTATEGSARIGELEEAGADQLVVALHDPHDTDALETLAHAAALTGS